MDKFIDGVSEVHREIGFTIGGLAFITCWIYCSFTYGFLFGFGLGWIPSLIIGIMTIGLWPFFIFLIFIFWTPVVLFSIGLIAVIKPFFH